MMVLYYEFRIICNLDILWYENIRAGGWRHVYHSLVAQNSSALLTDLCLPDFGSYRKVVFKHMNWKPFR